jgi:pyruvate-formate lyase-activating enzyme
VKLSRSRPSGANFHCRYCQNWEISQLSAIDSGGKKVASAAIIIYTDPTIFFGMLSGSKSPIALDDSHTAELKRKS